MTDTESRWGDEESLSGLCSVLDDDHCRQVVEYFRSADTEFATVDELLDHAVVSDDPFTDPRRTAVRLHHITLPKLADAGALEYDARQQDVRYTGHDALESLLDQTRPGESEVD